MMGRVCLGKSEKGMVGRRGGSGVIEGIGVVERKGRRVGS